MKILSDDKEIKMETDGQKHTKRKEYEAGISRRLDRSVRPRLAKQHPNGPRLARPRYIPSQSKRHQPVETS